MKIEELGLSTWAYHPLKRAGINTVGQLRDMHDRELLCLRNFGVRCLAEVREKLALCPITNGDRIRLLSDEELVEALFKIYRMTTEMNGGEISELWCDGKAGCVDEDGEVECDEDRHKACILRWLQQVTEVSYEGNRM